MRGYVWIHMSLFQLGKGRKIKVGGAPTKLLKDLCERTMPGKRVSSMLVLI